MRWAWIAALDLRNARVFSSLRWAAAGFMGRDFSEGIFFFVTGVGSER